MSLSQADIARIMEDPVEFISRLTIVSKSGKLVRLKPNAVQIETIDALSTGKDVVVLKARQMGLSTIVAAYLFWRWYTSPDPERYAVLSYKLASAKHLFGMWKGFFDRLPNFLRRPLAVDSTTEMVLSDTGAILMAASAQGDGGLRSWTCSAIWISEAAFSEGYEELKATAIASLNGLGPLIIESTANYHGDPVYIERQLIESGTVDGISLFFPWYRLPEYAVTPPDGWEADPSSPHTPEQQYWAEVQRGKLGVVKFRREYPETPEQAYAAVAGAWLDDGYFEDIEAIRLETSGGALAAVDPRDKYAIGVDVGAGTGGDWSTVVVLSALTRQVVDIRRSNAMSPTEWAEVVADASRKWNNAKVCVEQNGTWGGVVCNELRHMGVPQWTDNDGKYWTTTSESKPRMLEGVRDALSRNQFSQLDSWTIGELRSFKMDEKGRPYAPTGGLHHGDTVIGLALALVCLDTVRLSEKPFLPQWITERRVQNARKQGARHEFRRY